MSESARTFEGNFAEQKNFLLSTINIVQNSKDRKLRNSPEYFLVKCVVYPDDWQFEYWNVFISCLLLYTATVTPYRIAVFDEDTLGWLITDLMVDSLFFIDFIINCFLAYYDKNMTLIVDHRKIITNYARGWLFPDLFACFPLQLLSQDDNDYSNLIRVAKLPKLYRMIKLAKLLRLLKVVKSRNRLMRYMNSFLQISIVLERILMFILTFFLLIHLLACAWIFTGKLEVEFTDKNWMTQRNYQDANNVDIYIYGIYWAITTLTTVGYGDIRAFNETEEILACIVMIIGIIIYSVMIGSFTNMITSLDSKNAELNRKLNILRQLNDKYLFPKTFIKKVQRSLEYKHKENSQEVENLVNEFPDNLKNQLLLVIYDKLISDNAFFKNRTAPFKASVVQYLAPFRIDENQYIYRAGDPATEMFFIVKGKVQFEINYFEDIIPVKDVQEGYYFGELDIFLSTDNCRSHSVKAIEQTKLLSLSKDKLNTLINQFEDQGMDILLRIEARQSRFKKQIKDCKRIYRQGYFQKYESIPTINMEYDPNRIQEIEQEISQASSNKQSLWDLRPRLVSNPKFYNLVTKVAGLQKATSSDVFERLNELEAMFSELKQMVQCILAEVKNLI